MGWQISSDELGSIGAEVTANAQKDIRHCVVLFVVVRACVSRAGFHGDAEAFLVNNLSYAYRRT